MATRLVLWLVVLAPVATVAGALAYARWKGLPPARRMRELLFALVGLGLVAAGILAYEWWRSGQSETHRVHFQELLYLWLLLPVYAVVLLLQWRSLAGLSRGRLWLSFLLRSAVLILLFLALAGLQMVVEKDTITVLFALDRSKSVPDGEARRVLQFAKESLPAKRADDKVGLVIFGGQAATQVPPRETFTALDLPQLRAEVRPEATNIQAALRKARATFSEGTGKRLVFFTDGRQTEGRADEEFKALLAEGVDVWVAPLGRGDAPEMLVEEIKGISPELRWEEPFDARVYVRSNVAGKARVTLNTGEQTGRSVYQQIVDIVPNQKEPVEFKGLKLHSGGSHEIQATIEPLDPSDDTLAGNNHAYFFTEVQTDSRILILTSALEEVQHLRQALAGEKVALDIRTGAGMPEKPEEFRKYDCIVLANLNRAYIGDAQMAVIESCVKDQGAGLVMIGGDQSFGAGSYLNTPIERALPVSMDLKNQKVMPSGALVIVLHTCEFADGNSWGKKISKAAIDVLSPQDYAGLLYFGWGGPSASGNVWLFMPTPVVRKQWMFKLIDGCNPSDMPDLDGIVSMAVNSVARLQNVSLKHCIVITDGDPSPPTAGTIAAAKKGKVTITIVTIAPHGGADVAAMKSTAEQTGGSYYNPTDPRTLPQIFVKEAAIVRKSLIYQDDKGIPVSLGSPGEVLREFGQDFPKVTAFVVTSLKDRAELHLWTTVEGEKVPILARWNYGLGKALAFTSDSGARWATQWASWQSYQKLWANLFHWCCRQRMPAQHKVDLKVEGDKAHVYVEALDAEGKYKSFARLIGSASDPRMGQDPDATAHPLVFRMTAPGRYEAEFPVSKEGAYTVAVTDLSDPAKPNSLITGLANSYSKEYSLDLEGRESQMFFNALPEGVKKKDLGELLREPLKCGLYAHNLPPQQAPRDFFWPLLLAALCLLPLDIAVRRLRVEPATAAAWLGDRLAPVLGFLRAKKEELAEAAAEVARKSAGERAPPPPLVPTGDASRAAQSRYEQAGGSKDAKEMDLKPQAEPKKPAAIGGTKVSAADEAASEYTRALLKAKKRARKDQK